MISVKNTWEVIIFVCGFVLVVMRLCHKLLICRVEVVYCMNLSFNGVITQKNYLIALAQLHSDRNTVTVRGEMGNQIFTVLLGNLAHCSGWYFNYCEFTGCDLQQMLTLCSTNQKRTPAPTCSWHYNKTFLLLMALISSVVLLVPK